MDAATSNDNRYTKGIAAFVAGLQYADIPEKVIARAKLLILDTLGCGIYGTCPEHSKILITQLARIDSTKTCGVWGTKQRLSAPHATLANGSLVQGIELDDTHSLGAVHVGCGTLPPLVAITETTKISGKTFLAAAIAGFEVGPRVGMCMGHAFAAQGWHSGVLAVFPAAAAAARALGLSETQTIHALGIGGTQAAGLMAAQFGAMVKRMHAGRAAQSGLYGALLAKEGYTGIENLFESEYGGFCTTFSRSTDRFDMTELTKGLGAEYETMRVSLKFYSCAASIHTSLDAITAIRNDTPFHMDEIERIFVYASGLTVKHVGWKYEAQGLTSAQMNMSFCIATLIVEGDVSVRQFTPGVENDPKRIAIAGKTEIAEDIEVSSRGKSANREVRVEIILKDGRKLSRIVKSARGSDQQFATEAEVIQKFTNLASSVVPSKQVTAIVDSVLNLEKLNDANELAKLLTLA